MGLMSNSPFIEFIFGGGGGDAQGALRLQRYSLKAAFIFLLLLFFVKVIVKRVSLYSSFLVKVIIKHPFTGALRVQN